MAEKQDTFEDEIAALDDFAMGVSNETIELSDLESDETGEQNTTKKSGEDEGDGPSSEAGTETDWNEGQEVPASKEALQEMMQTIQDLKAKLLKDESSDEDITEEEEFLSTEATEIDLFSEVTYEEAVDNKESFTKFMMNLVKKVQEVTKESIYKDIPKVVSKYTNQQVTAKTEADNFYKNNPELADFKKDVAAAATLIASTKPGLKKEDFFNEVADYVRYTKKLEKTAKENENAANGKMKKNQKPALNNKSAGKTTRLVSVPELEGIEKEIGDMLAIMD